MNHNIYSILGKKPLVVASFSGSGTVLDAFTLAKKSGADCLEIRIDLLPKKSRDNLSETLSLARKKSSLGIIGTYRSSIESHLRKHKHKSSDKERKKILLECLPMLDFIDIEINSDKINREIVKAARKKKKKVILSYHDFQKVPDSKTVNQLYKKFKLLKGDILKIAGTPKSRYETVHFMNACQSLDNILKIFIPMGPLGQEARIYGFSFGSCMTYGYLGKHTAPGQWSAKELSEKVNRFFG